VRCMCGFCRWLSCSAACSLSYQSPDRLAPAGPISHLPALPSSCSPPALALPRQNP